MTEEQRPPESERAKRARARVGDAYVDERNPDGSGKRGYSWRQFEKGNTMSVVRHGRYSPRIISALAGELADWLASTHPDLAEPRYRFSVQAWARAETVAALLVHYLDQDDLVDAEGTRESGLKELRASERRASEERSKLGLSPADHARLEAQRAEAVKGVADLISSVWLRTPGAPSLPPKRARGSLCANCGA